MNTPITNFTVKDLFPNHEKPEKDPKCIVIAEVIKHLLKDQKMPKDKLQKDAEGRYNYLSSNDRISLPEADRRAFMLFTAGVPFYNLWTNIPFINSCFIDS